MEGFGMKTMKRMLLALLLALAPACAHAASILWVSVDPDASVQVKDPDGAILEESLRNFRLDGRSVNAAKVSASDGIGSTSYLLIAYDDLVGNVVADDPESNTIDLSELSGSSGGSSGGAGSGAGAEYVAVSLRDLIQTADLASTTITLELGYVDWNAYDTNYDPDNPATWEISTDKHITFDQQKGADRSDQKDRPQYPAPVLFQNQSPKIADRDRKDKNQTYLAISSCRKIIEKGTAR